jgi:glycosyltransferase involved in cell wall biosynthesis
MRVMRGARMVPKPTMRRRSVDPRVRLVTNSTNRGLVGNWNRCLDLASGDWIKFVFQDDTIHPDCLTQMLQ